MRLVFIEGTPGVGKSTASVELNRILENSGCSAAYYLEGSVSNPVDLYWTSYLSTSEYAEMLGKYSDFTDEIKANSICESGYALVRYQKLDLDLDTITKLYSSELHEYLRKREACYKTSNPVDFEMFTKIFRNRWLSFLSSDMAKCDYSIFDGAFLAHQISDMLRNYNPSDERVLRHLETLWDIVEPCKPIVFYLESKDVWERILSANTSRGQSIPPKEHTLFWENRKRLDLLALSRLPVESHRFDITDGSWNQAIEAMAAILIR